MTSGASYDSFLQPTVKRLGLDDGWWFFCTHFLNLGLPLVFIDSCLLPRAEDLGLEALGTRKPETPLPLVDLRITLLGNGVTLYNADASPPVVAAHWFRSLELPSARPASSVGIIVGDSYALQLSWSALWRCRIGAAAHNQTELEHADINPLKRQP